MPENKAFPPEGLRPSIVCTMQSLKQAAESGEILEALRRGASTVDGVKRRVGSGMGACQGSRCGFTIGRLLEEGRHGTL